MFILIRFISTRYGEWYNSYSRATYALGTLGLSAVGTKGLGAVTKTGMNTVKTVAKIGVSKVKGAAQKIPTLNLYPYAPQHQLAGVNAGIVPYNTVNSVGLRDQLISMAKVKSKGIENVKQGDKSSLAPGGGLATHELKGGHLIERHVGKTDEQLLERLKTNPKLTGSSTFKDRMIAEKVANTVLSDPKNIGKIKKMDI
ncbi:RNase A-like domain-containing protein [Rummeliibacillus suwonensis]|uniref:RNase A-like domain-containing protein n=1 Tax=Rummeliibacillus suwonensis TaxID=1306154 RepID=UPI002443F6DA|nr:RNase A-like domain-containing protein [Rummeliibacillus suwonensis]